MRLEVRGQVGKFMRAITSFFVVFFVACGVDRGPPPPVVLQPDAMKAEFPRYKELLLKYLAIDTTVPPGNERSAMPLLQEELTRIGLTSSVAAIGETRGNLYARLSATNPDPGARPLILMHHIDVVPVEREHWSVDAFSAVEKDGRIYGRGAIDIKHLGVVQLAALERLARAKDRLKRDVIYLAVSDEESEGLGAQLVVEKYLEEWKPEYLLDEGGFSLRKFLNDKDLVVIATTQKRVTRMRLTAHGEAGHGSRPITTGGLNILVEALHRLNENPREARLMPVTTRQLGAFGELAKFPQSTLLKAIDFPGVFSALEGTLSSNRNLNPSIRDTMALTIVTGGQKDNVIPADATATFDVRLLPDTDAEEFLKYVRGILGELPVTAELIYPPLPPMPESPTDDPLYAAIESAVRAHEPQATVSPWLCVGATDSRFFAPRGVKTYGFLSVFIDKQQVDSIHGHDENIGVDELEKGMVVYAEALERFLLR